MTPHSWITNIWLVVKKIWPLILRWSCKHCAITDARFGCSSPPFQLAQKFCHHKPISQAGNIIGLWWQIFCANAKDLHTNGKGGLLQMHRASLWLCKVGSDIGLWWLNFHANGKDGLLQLHWTSVFLRSSRNKWPDFFTTSHMLVTQLCGVTSYIQSIYIFLHKT